MRPGLENTEWPGKYRGLENTEARKKPSGLATPGKNQLVWKNPRPGKNQLARKKPTPSENKITLGKNPLLHQESIESNLWTVELICFGSLRVTGVTQGLEIAQ